MSAREAILARIRQRQGRPGDTSRVEARVNARQPGPHSQGLRGADLVQRFCQRAEALSSTIDQVRSGDAVPAAICRYLDQAGLPRRFVCWPSLAALPWPLAGLTAEARPARGEDGVGVTGVFCALAETGSLMLLSGAGTAAATSLLPETHIALVPVERVVATMDEGFALLRAEHGQLPRACNVVSGPSRTGDIEQTITLGAHGPYRVHIVLIGETPVTR